MPHSYCEKCGGEGAYVPEPRRHEFPWPPRREWPVCPDCLGTGLGFRVPLCQDLELTVGHLGIFGPFTKVARLRRKPGVKLPGGGYEERTGYDVWIDGKKLTRGAKYLRANSLEEAVHQTLRATDYRSQGIVENMRVRAA